MTLLNKFGVIFLIREQRSFAISYAYGTDVIMAHNIIVYLVEYSHNKKQDVHGRWRFP